MVTAVVYSDGGKSKAKGAYGSFKVFTDEEMRRHKEFHYNPSSTAPDTEAQTLSQVMLYIEDIERQVPGAVEWAVAIDAEWLYGHLTNDNPKVAKKHRNVVEFLRKKLKELDVTLIQVSGDEMKLKLGH